MLSFQDWVNLHEVTEETTMRIFLERMYHAYARCQKCGSQQFDTGMKCRRCGATMRQTFTESTNTEPVLESTTATRYSIEVNFRSKIKEALDHFAKIVLGYVSAALKQNNYHIKQVFEEKPVRIIVSSRNWDDGEWVGMVSFNPDHEGGSFVISKGFYNKDRKTISVQSNQKCKGDSAADIAGELRNLMHGLKDKPDRHQEKLKPVPLKRGPKS